VLKNQGIVASQVWNNAQDSYGISPDGRYINYIDWDNISLNLKDLNTGKTNVVSEIGTWIKPMEFPDNSIWSPDGKKIAYCWIIGGGNERTRELRIVNIDGSDNKVITNGNNQNIPWPVAWTSDGKNILGITRGGTEKNSLLNIVLVSVTTGKVSLVKSIKNLTQNDQMELSPDNKYIVYSSRQNESVENNDIYILSIDGKINKKLISDPANDNSPYWSPDGKEVLFVTDRHGTYDLWKIKVENGNPIGDAISIKSNISSKKRSLLGITKDNTIFYAANNIRTDIYIGNLEQDNNTRPIKISNFNTARNINPTWSPNGQQVVFSRFNDQRVEKLGHPHHFTLYDVKTNIHKNMDPILYGNTIMYNPKWSSNGKELLVQGLTKNGKLGGLFLYDINTNKTTPIKVTNNTNINEINELYRSFEYSNDEQSIFYLSEDKRSIIKYDIKYKQETSILSGTKTIHFFKISNDNTRIAFGYWFKNDRNLYTMSITGDDKKKIMTFENCDCSDNIIAWGKDDKYIYFKEGEFRNFKKIMRVSIDGGATEEIFDFNTIVKNGKVTRVNLHPDNNSVAIELEIGKGEIWKLNGIFNE